MRWPTMDDVIDNVLALLVVAICAPGLIWWALLLGGLAK